VDRGTFEVVVGIALVIGGCPDLELPRQAFICEEGGREFELHCPSQVCPPSRLCGTADDPTSYCCAEGETCERETADEMGFCRPLADGSDA
jgi:hypothetical protein